MGIRKRDIVVPESLKGSSALEALRKATCPKLFAPVPHFQSFSATLPVVVWPFAKARVAQSAETSSSLHRGPSSPRRGPCRSPSSQQFAPLCSPYPHRQTRFARRSLAGVFLARSTRFYIPCSLRLCCARTARASLSPAAVNVQSHSAHGGGESRAGGNGRSSWYAHEQQRVRCFRCARPNQLA